FASVANEVLAVAITRRHSHIESMSNAPQMAEVAALVGDPARANILCALPWRRSFTRARQAPSLLPPVCGLDRTTTAYRGCSWCGFGEPLLRTEMDRPGARQSRPPHYASRPPRADGSLRAFNLTAARLAPGAGGGDHTSRSNI